MVTTGYPPAGSPFASAAPLALRPLSAIAATLSGGVPQSRIERILGELIADLDPLHRDGSICGDISVHSVGLDETGRAHLMAISDLGPRSERTPTITPGYAPYELFTESPDWPRGPWTDIYALSAVAYALVCGQHPPPAQERLIEDHYQPLTGLGIGQYSETFLRAIDAGMALFPVDRPPTLEVYAELLTLPILAQRTSTSRPMPDVLGPALGASSAEPSAEGRSGGISPGLGLLVLVIVAMVAYWWGRQSVGTHPVITHSERVDPAAQKEGAPIALSAPTTILEPPQFQRGSESPSSQGEAPQSDKEADTNAMESALSSPDHPVPDPADSVLRPGAADSVDLAPPAPAKAEPKAAARVKVSINVRPWGEIFVDGVSRGVTPPLKTIMLRPGKYKVTVRNSTQPPFHTTLTVEPGTPAVITHLFR